jgi:bifunctional DNA-binding transcriptional regulator/antitoxin component of YhaV-PrlF toxin-antitoxin module
MNQLATLGKSGRLVIPVQFRKILGLNEGEGLILKLKGDHIEISSVQQSIKKAQSMVSKYLKKGDSLVNILLEGRRKEVSYEH